MKNIRRGKSAYLPSRKDFRGIKTGMVGKKGNRKTGRHEGLPVRIWANSYSPSRKEAIDDLKNICPPENGARNQDGNGGKKGKQENRKTGRHEGLPVRIWANSYSPSRKEAIDDLKNICRGRLTCLPSRKEARNQGGETGRHEGLPVRIWANLCSPSKMVQLMI